MGWSAPTGRPYVFPEDTTDLNGLHIQVRPRIAWLLRTNRLDSPYRRPEDFIARVKALGRATLPGGPSDIETRNRPLNAAMILTYEVVLGLPKGSLIGPADTLSRSFTDRRLRHPSRVHPEDRWAELARLEGKFQDRSMTGGDWLSFSNLLNQPEGLPMFPSTLEEWTHRLVTEMMRSVGTAYMARMEAISRLLQERHPGQAVVRVVQDAIAERGAQGTVDAVAALGDAPRTSAIDTVIDIFESTEGGSRLGAALALHQWAILGEFTDEERHRATRAVVAVAHDDPRVGAVLVRTVATALSPASLTPLRRITGAPEPQTPLAARSYRPPGLRRCLEAAYAYSQAPGDRMIERLLQEALTDEPGGRRHHALILIGSSPYRRPVADAAAELFEASADPAIRHTAGHMLSYLGGSQHQPLLVRMLHDADTEVQSQALIALAHSSGVPESVDLREHLTRDGVASCAIYAAGMSHHPDVVSARDSRFVRPEIRQSATWWLHHGPRVDVAN